MPFVQGHLRHEATAVTIRSECAHCGRPIGIEIDGTLDYRVTDGAELRIFVPLVDFTKLKAPNIIDDF